MQPIRPVYLYLVKTKVEIIRVEIKEELKIIKETIKVIKITKEETIKTKEETTIKEETCDLDEDIGVQFKHQFTGARR